MNDYHKPGETVPRSGIYHVKHNELCAVEHEVTCIFGKPFPPCNSCGGEARFTLIRSAKDVETHERFAAR